MKTKFYSIEIPESLTYERLKSDKEDLSNTDVFKIVDSKKQDIKYLIYLMSNKLNSNAETLSENNLNEYLKDLGKVEILNHEKIFFKNSEIFKLKLSLGKEIIGVVYLTNVNNVLYRMLFMVPDKFYTDIKNEIDLLLSTTLFLKDNWDDV
ncbi:hypothetical protein [Flavivirga jejuensis]|uniref:hypothetical protein n=1 Tax=Flavivirga jejuensis TaxID=870487 RepID=UPI0026DFC311|nr:hypothetical protein [Flavivirga jejuensis]